METPTTEQRLEQELQNRKAEVSRVADVVEANAQLMRQMVIHGTNLETFGTVDELVNDAVRMRALVSKVRMLEDLLFITH